MQTRETIEGQKCRSAFLFCFLKLAYSTNQGILSLESQRNSTSHPVRENWDIMLRRWGTIFQTLLRFEKIS